MQTSNGLFFLTSSITRFSHKPLTALPPATDLLKLHSHLLFPLLSSGHILRLDSLLNRRGWLLFTVGAHSSTGYWSQYKAQWHVYHECRHGGVQVEDMFLQSNQRKELRQEREERIKRVKSLISTFQSLPIICYDVKELRIQHSLSHNERGNFYSALSSICVEFFLWLYLIVSLISSLLLIWLLITEVV